jgi:hypothetical protein
MLAPGRTAAASQEIAWALPSLGGDGLDNDWLPSQGNFSDGQLENGGISQEVANTSGALAGGSVPGSMEPNLAIATTVVSTTPGRHLSARTARETDMALLSLEADGFGSDWSPQTAAAQSATLSPALVDALMSKVPV